MQKIRKVFAKVVAGLLIVSNLAIAAPSMTYAASATSFTTYGGWNEMMYATIKGVKDADVTAVSYSGPVSGSLTGEDFEYLVRDTADGARVDVMGLKPGTYTLKVTTKTGTYTQSGIEVNAQDRSGYAHYNYTDGVGAYNDDGTLKDNAIVLYVTDENKNTVTLSYGGVTVAGIGNILNSVGKACGEAGHETECKKVSKGKTYYGKGNTNQGILQLLAENNIPLVIRMVGAVSESGLYKTGTWAAANAGLIDGLTDYDSNDYGGSVGDNGHMARMKSAKDVTIEGVGTDAAMDGWGIHFMSETSTTAAGLGKNFEVRNLTFMNQPEDAIGMEGVQEGSVITAPVERCWIHNNEFYSPSITGPAESDKAEGDGSCDFKRGEYLTVSYNYFEGCHKTNLVGSSDTSLQYNLTYHHNIWKGCKARQPLGRQANMHFYNNQFIGTTDYAMNTRANAYIYSEYNLFFMTKNPMDVRSGAIKSYNDSFSSCIGAMTGTVVTDKSTKVKSGNKYENFDTDAALSYIPSGTYQLQTSVTDAAKVLKAYNGCMPETVKKLENVTASECSLLSYCAPGVTPINISDYPYTATPGKLSKTVYAFTVGGTVDVTVSFASEALTTTGCLVNEAGECFQVGSGTVTGLPAGTYMVMPYNIQSGGNGVNPAAGTFKEMTINSIKINAADSNAHYHNYVSKVTREATCTEEGEVTYTCIATNGTCDKKTYTEVIPKKAHTYGEWKVVKEATETEEGLKSHSCTVCGAEETASIPKKGSTGGTETPEVPTGDSKVHNFTTSDANSSFFVISGNLASNKGTVTYNGLTLTQCLKMESSTSIKFTAPSAGKLTLVFGGTTAASGKGVKVNGTSKKVGSDGTLTVDVAKGAVTVTKGDAINLFYMIYTPSGTSETTHTHKYESKITKQATCTEAGVLTYTCTSTTGTCDKKTYTETIPAKGHSFSTEWTVDVEATETTPGSKSHHCTVCDAKTDVTEIPATGVVEKKNGLSKAEDGNYYYYADDVVDTSFTGFADCDNERMYVKNGKVDTTYTSVEQDGADWVYVENGKIRYDYTGIRQNSNGWWRIEDGKVNFNFTGLADNENGRFYIQNGKVNFEYTNLIQDGADWVYVKNGHVKNDYTGFAENENGRFYLENGKVNFEYTNVIQDGADWVYVEKGHVNTNYTGIRQNANGWWRIKDGKVDFSYTGLADNENGRFYIENGKVNFKYTNVIQDGADWVYVKNGHVQSNYTGFATNENGRFYLENGKVNFGYTNVIQDGSDWVYVKGGYIRYDYTGIRQNANGWWRIENGKVNFKYNGVASNENGMFYLENGLVKFNYTGTYIQDGIKYNIVNGVVKGKENVLTVMRMPYSVLTNSIKMVI